MNSRRSWTHAVVVASAVLIVSCGPDGWQPPSVVRFRTDQQLMALQPSWISWMSDGDRGLQTLLLRDGDFVGGSDFVFRYSTSDGASVDVTFEDGLTRLDGRVISVDLEEDAARRWFAAASPDELARVRTVGVGELDEATVGALQRFARVNPGADLAFSTAVAVEPVLALFNPRTVFFDDGVAPTAHRALAGESRLELLMIAGADQRDSLSSLPPLPALRRLLLGDWNAAESGPLPSLPALTSLVILDAEGMKDLSALAPVPATLEELSLLGIGDLSSLSGIERFASLNTLVLSGNARLTELSALRRLEDLRWLALPPAIDQEQFASVIAMHPNLVVLDLMDSEALSSLAPLARLERLQALILGRLYPDLADMRQVRSLQYVGIAAQHWEASAADAARIRAALPDAAVVRVRPLCLGSGWILALIPALILTRRRRARLSRCADAA